MTTEPVEIDPAKVYSDGVILAQFGVPPDVLARERKAGRLRSVKAGRKHLYKGDWLLTWMERAATPELEAAAC